MPHHFTAAPPLENGDDGTTVTVNKTKLLKPHHRTSPLIWCVAVLCLILALLLILSVVSILLAFLIIRPKIPTFSLSTARLAGAYVDSSAAFYNGDLSFLANFTNPNPRLDVAFHYITLRLYFDGYAIAAQAVAPFAERSGETRMVSMHMVSSEVRLPAASAVELMRQVAGNRVRYGMRGRFQLRASWGAIRFAYWVHGWCDLETTAPPIGALVASSCRTKAAAS